MGLDADLLQKFGFGLIAIVGGIGMYFGRVKGDGKPPADRPIPPIDVAVQTEKLKQDLIAFVGELADDNEDRQKTQIKQLTDIIRILDRIEYIVSQISHRK